MPIHQQLAIQKYLARKEELLQQCIDITKQLSQFIGDRQESTLLLQNRKRLLMTLEQLDIEYAPDLSNYHFTQEEFATITQLADTMWLLDEQITLAMRSNKDAIRQMMASSDQTSSS